MEPALLEERTLDPAHQIPGQHTSAVNPNSNAVYANDDAGCVSHLP